MVAVEAVVVAPGMRQNVKVVVAGMIDMVALIENSILGSMLKTCSGV